MSLFSTTTITLKKIFQHTLGSPIVRLFFSIVIVIPLSYFIPKKKDLIIIAGRRFGSFSENSKYIYLYLKQHTSKDVWFLTQTQEVYEDLIKQSLPVLYQYQWTTTWKLLRAKIIITDSFEWHRNSNYHKLFNAYKIQLWHGAAPTKSGERQNPTEIERRKSLFLRLLDKLKGRFPSYDLVVINHPQYEKDYQLMFRSNNVKAFGLPRNDYFYNKNLFSHTQIQVDQNCYDQLNHWKTNNHRTLLYAPTFRDRGEQALKRKGGLNLSTFNEFLREHNYFLIVAHHPYVWPYSDLGHHSNIIFDQINKDIIPLMEKVDLLITDYSSIYFEFLFLNRPILFFPFDYQEYTEKDRKLYPDFLKRLPGPLCHNQKELMDEIVKTFAHKDSDPYTQNREQVIQDTFYYQDGNNCKRIYEYIEKNI